jgi:hypothetical protein
MHVLIVEKRFSSIDTRIVEGGSSSAPEKRMSFAASGGLPPTSVMSKNLFE